MATYLKLKHVGTKLTQITLGFVFLAGDEATAPPTSHNETVEIIFYSLNPLIN